MGSGCILGSGNCLLSGSGKCCLGIASSVWVCYWTFPCCPCLGEPAALPRVLYFRNLYVVGQDHESKTHQEESKSVYQGEKEEIIVRKRCWGTEGLVGVVLSEVLVEFSQWRQQGKTHFSPTLSRNQFFKICDHSLVSTGTSFLGPQICFVCQLSCCLLYASFSIIFL